MGDLIVGLFSSMIALSVPLLIAAEGEVFVERSGQFNMGIEGIMVVGAMSAFATTLASGSVALGFLAGAIAGALSALFIFVLIQRLHIGGVLVAIVFNLISAGVTGFLSALFINSNSVPMQSAKVQSVSIPFLSDLPVVGKVLLSQNILVYLAFAFVLVIHRMLFHSKFGLRLRAVGGNAQAAQSMGIDVYKIKRSAFAIGGLTGGLAGAYMSLTLGMFVENMTANKGFIALALCTFSRANPIGTFFGAMLFALADSLQIRLQIFKLDIPYEFFLMLPYVMTILVLVITAKRREQTPKIRLARAGNGNNWRRIKHESSK